MKVLLIQPNSAEEVNKEYLSLQYPVNLGYIAAVLRKNGDEVRMVDFNTINRKKLPEIVAEFGPELAGITAMTSSINNAKSIISEIKKINKNIITVLGGVHASALPLETMKNIKALDYLVFGEGEMTMAELSGNISIGKGNESVNGLVWRSNGRIIKNSPRALIEDLNTIPFPARDLLPMELYAKHHVSRGFSRAELKIVEIITSRGCPNRCIFCAGHINYGNKLRFRSFENIAAEIAECIKKYGTNHISIEDDTFTINRELVGKLCGFLSEKKMTWNCNARVNTVDYEMLKLMAASGCRKISFGVESGNPEILKKIKKGITIPAVIKAVSDAKKAGVRFVECTFMIGSHVDETPETVNDTIKLIYELMPDFIAVSIMCPYPGTEIYDIMKEKGCLNENPDWSQFSFFGDLKRYKKLPHLSLAQMSALQHKILKEYYGSPKYIISQLRQMRTFNEMKYFGRLGILFVKEMAFKKMPAVDSHLDAHAKPPLQE